jgi:N6-adenosine-specific RNA methylase IME4
MGDLHPIWAELDPPYKTLVVDPPWKYNRRGPRRPADESRVATEGTPWPYTQMDLPVIQSLPIEQLADEDARIFLWVTNKYLRHAFGCIEAWGFTPGRTLTWTKPPRGTMNVTTEFLVLGSRGSPKLMPWVNTTWFDWGWQPGHSQKPAAAYDLIETWGERPRVDIFARQARLGWDSWGLGVEAAPEVM